MTVYKGRDGHSSRNPNPQGPTTTGNVQSPSNSIAQITLPALPPRDTTTATAAPSAAGPLWAKQQSQSSGNYIDSLFGRKSGGAAADKNASPIAGAAAPAGGGDSSQPVAQPTKEKKDSSAVSLMKRLTNIKRSKSPTTSANNGGTANPAYSMDNPVFEDSTASAAPVVKQNLQQMINPVHVRLERNDYVVKVILKFGFFLDLDHVPVSCYRISQRIYCSLKGVIVFLICTDRNE